MSIMAAGYMRTKTERELADEALEAAQLEVARLEAIAQEQRHQEYVARNQAAWDRMMALPDEDFTNPEPRSSYSDVRPYVLPFGKGYPKWNPVENDEEHDFGDTWTANSTAIICQRTDQDRSGPSRLIWTSGCTMPKFQDGRVSSDTIGSQFHAKHDQTGASLGHYRIVGLAFYGPEGGRKPGRIIGQVPDKKFGQSTYK